MQFKCVSCGEVFWNIKRITCPYCNGLLTPVYEWRLAIREDLKGVWRFREALPRFRNTVTMGEANTPLLESSRLFKDMNVYFKDEGRNPTGSFRDRVAPLIIADALDTGARKLILASDGNMGASIAAYAARAGLKVTVYGPSLMEDAKALLIRAFGAKLILSDQSIDSLLEMVSRKTASGKTYDASSLHNPLSIEGLKTIAYEIFLELKEVPEKIFLPLGSGVTLLALYKGFRELTEAGLANRIPKLIGVEHCGSPKYSQVLKEKVEKCREPVLTGLGYSQPYIQDTVLKVIEDHGDVVVIGSSEAVKAAKILSKKEGLFVEPSSAVSLAGFFKHGEVENSVILLTGHGLKAPLLYTRPNRKRFSAPFPGITKKMILELVSNKPGLTGYEIWKHLGIDVTPQAVYQHLRDLVEMGYVEVKIEAGVKKYFARRIESLS